MRRHRTPLIIGLLAGFTAAIAWAQPGLPPPSVGAGGGTGDPEPALAPRKPGPARATNPAGADSTRLLQVGLRVSSPAAASGATVVASAGPPVEPIETKALVREGERVRLSLAWAPPPSSLQRRAPQPPVTIAVELIARVDGPHAQVQAQWIGQSAPMPLSLPLGTWFDVTSRGPAQRTDRQVISSTSARPDAALVMLRVDPVAPAITR